MRAIWSGAIGFGLVNIPVKMFSAVQDSNLDLDMLDKHDNSHIRFKRVNESTGKEVQYADIVKGFKVGRKYVILDDEDFEAAAPKKSAVIEIEEFVAVTDIDVTYYEAPYFLAPDKGGERSYALLREALADSGKIGIGTYVMRGKEHLCAMKSTEDVILLHRLRFAEEIRDTSELDLPDSRGVKANELEIAKSLIDHMTNKKFSIAKYKDTYHKDLMKIIKAKAKGSFVPEPKFTIVKSNAKDLMAQLKASLEADKPKKRAG
jgi:DNA end-binding protein Ku